MITVDFERLGVQPGDHILDIGCGTGRHTCEAYEQNNVTITGVDLDLNDLREARSRLQFHEQLKKHKSRWGLISADIAATPFTDSYFDLVICSEVLEHIPDHESAADELIRILKPGCIMAVSVPRTWPEKICWALSHEYANTTGGHIRIYRKEEIIGLFEKRGLQLIGSHFAHSLHSPFWWLKCLVGVNRNNVAPVKLYNEFLTWDIMKKPRITRLLEKMMNSVLGKSMVFYFKKINQRPRSKRPAGNLKRISL